MFSVIRLPVDATDVVEHRLSWNRVVSVGGFVVIVVASFHMVVTGPVAVVAVNAGFTLWRRRLLLLLLLLVLSISQRCG